MDRIAIWLIAFIVLSLNGMLRDGVTIGGRIFCYSRSMYDGHQYFASIEPIPLFSDRWERVLDETNIEYDDDYLVGIRTLSVSKVGDVVCIKRTEYLSTGVKGVKWVAWRSSTYDRMVELHEQRAARIQQNSFRH